ncbi:MAG: hypothetical protein JNJ55_05645 [Betaproteobacteria bacterium]|nr:hypothetical protein [Betaproteobacteria bacterium]
MNTPQVPDDDFDHDRKVVSAAYARVDEDARTPHDGPPPAIDAAIRAAARRAVGAGPRPVERPWFARWSKPLSAAAVFVLTTSVIFVAIEQDSSLKVETVRGPLETKVSEMRADKPVEVTIHPAAPAADLAIKIEVPREPAAQVANEARARQTDALSSRDQAAPALSSEQKKRDNAPVPSPQVIIAESSSAAQRSFKSETPVVANAAPVTPPVYAPASPPAPAPAAPASRAPTPPVQVASYAAPPPAAAVLQGLAKEKAAGRVADARTEAESARAAVAESKAEKVAVTGSKVEPDQQAAKPIALASAAKSAMPAALATEQRNAPPVQPAIAIAIAIAPELAQAFVRLRELRAQMQWKEFDELLADVQKRWPNAELPMDLAVTKREREKAKAGDSR